MTFVSRTHARTPAWMAIAAIVMLLGLMPSSAHAQMPNPGSYDLTPFLGVSFGGDADGGSFAIGGAVAYNYSTRLAFEGELALLTNATDDTSAVDVRVLTFTGNALYRFNTRTRFAPYAAVGIGLGRTSFQAPAGSDSTSTDLAFNVGGGVKAEWQERIMFRADLRFFQLADISPSFWRLYGGISFRFDR